MPPSRPQPWLLLMRKFSGVLCYVLAGIFLASVPILALMDGPLEFLLMAGAVCLVPSVPLLFIGMACLGFRRWQHDGGVLLLTIAAVGAICFVSMACMLSSAEMVAMMGPEASAMQINYLRGPVLLAVLGALGWWLYRKGSARMVTA